MASSSKAQSRPSLLPPSIPTPSPQRLHALYADFSRQKSFNPSAYAANVDWWRRALPEIVAHRQTLSDHLVVDASDKFIEELRTESGARPLSLGTVVLEMLESNSIYPLSTFLSSSYSIYDTGSLPWRIGSLLVGKPLWWLMAQLKLVGDPIPADESTSVRWKRAKGKYVLRDNLEKAADAVIQHQRSKPRVSITETLHNLASFRQEFGHIAIPGVTLSETDVKVLLKYLERDRKFIVMDKEVIKFVDEDEEEETKITDVDHGVLEMKLAVQRLQDQISEVDRRISECTEKIKDLLAKRQPEMAKSYLRSRKQLEDVLSKRTNSLETVQGVVLKIESAAGDIEVMKAYETSSVTLKKLLADPRLQREHVDATMESMSDALADHAEIEEAIKLGGESARSAAGVDVDESELAAELEGLVKEREEEERREKDRQEAQRDAENKRRARQVEAEKNAAEAKREREVPQLPLEQGQSTSSQEADNAEWQRRWEAAQTDRAVQAMRDKQEDVRLRTQWAEQDAKRAPTAQPEAAS